MIAATTLARPAILAACITLAVVVMWECYLRQDGQQITYDDSAELWADKRARVYRPKEEATVFIGASRMKYDLNIQLWEQRTGKEAVQLAVNDNSPLLILEDLGNDPDFKGNLIVDVTELVYYSQLPDFNKKSQEYIEYYHDETYAQKSSFQLNHLLESGFVFLDKEFLSLCAMLHNLSIADREGVWPSPKFPINFVNHDFDRQTWMNPRFLTNQDEINAVTSVCNGVIKMITNAPQPRNNPIPGILKRTKTAVEKIRARGGDVVFTRTPSSSPLFEVEEKIFNRAVAWEPLLAATNSKGYHFKDYPVMASMQCPEWSHLSVAQTEEFTTELIRILPPSFTR